MGRPFGCNTCERTMEGLAEKEAGNAAFRAGDTEKAIHFYSLAVEANPSEATYYSNRSAAFHKLGSYQKAQADAAMCIQLRPDWPKGYYRLGEAYFGQNLFAKASEEYSRALDLEPNDVGVREALARAEKSLYNKVLEERVERPEPTVKPTGGRSKLLDYDSDDDDDYRYETRERGQTATHSCQESSGGYKSIEEKHKEIMNRRMCQGTGITSLEDYLRYRNAGGGQLQQDEITGLMKVVAPEVKPSQSKADLFKSLGIDAPSPSVGSVASPSSSGGPTFSSTCDPSESKKADLARQRAEFMASLSSNNSTSNTDPFWSKLQASEKAANAKAPSSTSSSSYRPVATEEDDQWRPSSVSTVHSDISTQPTTLGTSVFNRTPPMHGRRSVRGSETPPDTPPSYAMPRNAPNAPGIHREGSFAQGSQKANSKDSDDAEADTIALAQEAMKGASVAANHPLFAGLKARAVPYGNEGAEAMRNTGTEDGRQELLAGVAGQGSQIANSWMAEFLAKKKQGEQMKVEVGDEKIVELKKQYSNFHYRRYKENTGDDETTKRNHLMNAITAEALAGYDYKQMT
uniref:Uncharacterized protein n=1 Tax=Eutreptiella gymnastica TaxID=73025 RepID=A0A7S1NP22_9EUGL